jgi:hypothetical protein
MTPATERNAILDSAEAITSQELAQRRIELAGPVTAKFHTDEVGSTGIELTVRLRDSRSIAAAKAAIVERFGGIARCDAQIVT